MPLIDVIEETDAFSIVMPYYELGSLKVYRPVDEQSAYERVFLQILLAFSWLHSRGVVHSDIKPEKFLLDDDEGLSIIVAEFGLSNVTTQHLLTTFCGSLTYCAPEVFPGNSRGYGSKADMWSLGIMMMEFVFGLPDAPGDVDANSSHAVLQNWVEEWSTRLQNKLTRYTGVEDPMWDILSNMIKSKPEDRFSAGQCLQRGLENGLFRRNLGGQHCSRHRHRGQYPSRISLASRLSR